MQTKVLYGKALEFCNLKGNETVIDLYCGVGTISMFLAAESWEGHRILKSLSRRCVMPERMRP